MNYFFVDFENVHSGGFFGIENYCKDDVLYLMYTDKCESIQLKVVDKLMKNRHVSFNLMKVAAGGKNALDFQLATHLGYVISKTEDQNAGYYIISNDTGFDFVVRFWNENGVFVRRIPSFSSLNKQNNRLEMLVPVHTAKTENIAEKATASDIIRITEKNSNEKIAAAEEKNKGTEQERSEEKEAVKETGKSAAQEKADKKVTVKKTGKAAEQEKLEEKVTAKENSKASEQKKAKGKATAKKNGKIVEQDITEEKSTKKETVKENKTEKKGTVKKSETKSAASKPKSESNSGIASKKELLKYITDEEYSDRILEIINQYKTKVSIKNGFDKEYRNANVSGALYKKVRPYLKSIGKT